MFGKKFKNTVDECINEVRVEKMHQIKELSRVKEPVIGYWLLRIGEVEKEMKLPIKVSSLRNKYGHMKVYRRPGMIEGITVKTFVQNLFKKTLVHSVHLGIQRTGA